MPSVLLSDIERMRESVFFEGPDLSRQYSRFWILLTLAAIIASAGVVGDSTATVIGAMIVAPLMTPILGTMLAIVLGDRANLIRSVLLVVTGATLAIAIGYVVGLLAFNDVIAASNSQVAARVNPRLIDLLAALATGAVGSVALVRRDISDTLPGVAIAISLVPPLVVVGLTAESGAYSEASGALLLFGTNVAAILLSGLVVMALCRVQHVVVASSPERKSVNRRNAALAVTALVVVIGIPLTSSTIRIATQTATEARVRRASTAWAEQVGWNVVDVSTSNDEIAVRLLGPPPLPDTESFKPILEAEDIDPSNVVVEFIPEEVVALGGG